MSAPAFKYRLEYAGYRLARRAVRAAPERMALAAGSAIGRAVGDFLRVRRTDVDRHLAWAFPEESAAWRAKVSRACYAHFGREAAVTMGADRWESDVLRQRSRMVGFEPFRDAASSGSGLVLLTGHLGNWEMGGAAIAAHGVPLDVVGKGMSNRRFQADLFAARERLGMRVIEMGDASRDALRALAAGRVVAVLGDQQAHKGGIPVPFFGRPASTARGPALFALRSGAPIFVAFCVSDPGPEPRYTITFQPLEYVRAGNAEADVESVLIAYGATLESAIRRTPEQYFWHHRRWKNAP